MSGKEKPQKRNSLISTLVILENEAKTVNDNNTIVEWVNVNKLQPLKLKNDDFMHNRISYSKSKLSELASSIKELRDKNSGIGGSGYLQPIMARDSNGRLEIIHGENRTKAAIINDIEEVPCIILKNVSDELARFMRTAENLNREDLNPYDETLSILEQLMLSCEFEDIDTAIKFINKIKNYSSGKTSFTEEEKTLYKKVEETMKRIGRYTAITFVDRLVLLRVQEIIKKALVDGLIGYKQAILINRLEKLDDIELLIKRVSKQNMAVSELKKVVAAMLCKDNPNNTIIPKVGSNKIKEALKTFNERSYQKLPDNKKQEVDSIFNEIEKMIEKANLLVNEG